MASGDVTQLLEAAGGGDRRRPVVRAGLRGTASDGRPRCARNAATTRSSPPRWSTKPSCD